jgi:hypothetical protein
MTDTSSHEQSRNSMSTVHHPADTDPQPPAPYFRVLPAPDWAAITKAVELEKARRARLP